MLFLFRGCGDDLLVDEVPEANINGNITEKYYAGYSEDVQYHFHCNKYENATGYTNTIFTKVPNKFGSHLSPTPDKTNKRPICPYLDHASRRHHAPVL